MKKHCLFFVLATFATNFLTAGIPDPLICSCDCCCNYDIGQISTPPGFRPAEMNLSGDKITCHCAVSTFPPLLPFCCCNHDVDSHDNTMEGNEDVYCLIRTLHLKQVQPAQKEHWQKFDSEYSECSAWLFQCAKGHHRKTKSCEGKVCFIGPVCGCGDDSICGNEAGIGWKCLFTECFIGPVKQIFGCFGKQFGNTPEGK